MALRSDAQIASGSVAFSLDCYDRQAIDFAATTAGIRGGLDRNVMVETISRRFGEVAGLPSPAEWLSDNGAALAAEQWHGRVLRQNVKA